MGAPTLVPSSPRRKRVVLESLDKTKRQSNSLRWINTRKALDKVLVCWIGVLVAVLTVLAVK
jgi:hypothetical protein